MEYRLLGRSGLKVSTITMGTMTFGGSQKIGDTDQKGPSARSTCASMPGST